MTRKCFLRYVVLHNIFWSFNAQISLRLKFLIYCYFSHIIFIYKFTSVFLSSITFWCVFPFSKVVKSDLLISVLGKLIRFVLVSSVIRCSYTICHFSIFHWMLDRVLLTFFQQNWYELIEKLNPSHLVWSNNEQRMKMRYIVIGVKNYLLQ